MSSKQRRLHHRLPRVHPVHIAANRIDFAVVAEIAERMRQLPGGKSVGREALVHQAHGARRIRIQQFVVEFADLVAPAASLCRRWCATRTTECRRSSSRADRIAATRASARLRTTYSLRSNSSSVSPAGRATKNCSMYGCEARATRPMASTSTGVSRQPRTADPSSRAICSSMPSQASRCCGSTGRKHMATPYWPCCAAA